MTRVHVAVQSMTYGELPSRSAFARHFRRIVETSDGDTREMQMHLKGSDADCGFAHSEGIYDGNNWYNEDEVWGILNDLTRAFHDGSDCAGDLASSILYVLDFEWI